MQSTSVDSQHETTIEGEKQFLSFYLGGDVYGVDILRVQEIRGWESVRAIPNMPEQVKGVLDLRGTIVPVIDLRVRFELSDPEYSTTTVMIVLNVHEQGGTECVIGAVVDAVSDVLDVAAKEIKPAPRLGGCIGSCYLSGMVSLEERMVILLDIDKLFDSEEIRLQEV